MTKESSPDNGIPNNPREISWMTCPACGARNNRFAKECWICHSSLDHPLDEQMQCNESATCRKPEFAEGLGAIFGNLLLGLLLLALVLVGIGVFRINSTWFVYYVVFITLPLLAAAVGLRHALHSKNQDIRRAGAILTSIYATLLTILGTAAVVIATVVALIVSFFVALGQICSDLLNSGN